MGEPTYRCLECRDVALVLTERFDAQGRSLGCFGSPCICAAGEARRAAWLAPDSRGHVFADSAMNVTEELRRRN